MKRFETILFTLSALCLITIIGVVILTSLPTGSETTAENKSTVEESVIPIEEEMTSQMADTNLQPDTEFTQSGVLEQRSEEASEDQPDPTTQETIEETEVIAPEESTKDPVPVAEETGTKKDSYVEPGKNAESAQGLQSIPAPPAEDLYAPIFLSFNASPEVKVGETFNVHKFAGYADDYDREVALEVIGEVDMTNTGIYPITLLLTDDAGHTTQRGMDVQVVSSLSSSGTRTPESFSDFISRYKTDGTSVGIDISRWQGDVDFERVKATGCEFVYMRLGGFDEGEHYTDRYYRQNIAGAKAAGLKVGVYWHAEERNPEEVKTSVDYLLKVLDGETLDFPIAYDWEDFMNFERYGMNLYDINICLDTFAAELHAKGYSACLYSSKNYLEVLWTNDKNVPVWLAHYTKSTSYAGDYFMWQHSCSGRIDGISGDVDLNVLYDSGLPLWTSPSPTP